MSNPPGPWHDDQSVWARPSGPTPPPSESPTQQMKVAPAPPGGDQAATGGNYAPTGGVHAPTGGVHAPTGGVHAPTGGEHAPTGGEHAPTGGEHAPTGGEHAPTGGDQEPPTTRITAPLTPPTPPAAPPMPPMPPMPPTAAEPPAAPYPGHQQPRLLRDPLAVALIIITVIALALAGVIGAELIARRIADGKVAAATECEVHDQAKASFGVTPPFLWQHITGRYTNISIKTAGNQVKDAKQMQADIDIADVSLHGTGDSRGTIGTLNATLTWPAAGIKETVQSMVPVLGALVSDLKTNAADGTVELKGAFGLAGVTVRPQVVNGGLSLQVLSLTGLGSLTLPRETVQPALDEFATALTKKYPLGLRADSIQVTDTGIVAHFSTHNASIPRTDDPCFAHL